MSVDLPVNDETIGLYRRGSDIDVEAIFGGNIAGRRLTGVKINPLFLEGQSEEDVRQTESLGRNGYQTRDPAIRLDVYDLRSPAHSVNGENGKRQTIVKIGRHEILSVSTTNGAHQTTQGEIRVKTSSNAPATPDGKANTDCFNKGCINIQTDDNSAFVSVLTESTPGASPNSERSPNNSVNRSPTPSEHSVPPDQGTVHHNNNNSSSISKDVREVVVSYSESADRPVMDEPGQPTKWPDGGSDVEYQEIDSSVTGVQADGQASTDKSQSVKISQTTGSSEVKTLKPILVRSQSSFDSLLSSAGLTLGQFENGVKEPSKPAITKTVKFADDTIDNENKTKRYMKERIDLSKVHNGKILVENAYGTVNPVYLEQEEDGENVNNNHTDLPPYDQLQDLNIPSYMQKYLDVSSGKPVATGSESSPYSPSHTTVIPEPAESEESPGDTSQDTEMSEVPGYEAQVMKSVTEKRRRQAIRWTIITVVVVAILILAIALPVYFSTRQS